MQTFSFLIIDDMDYSQIIEINANTIDEALLQLSDINIKNIELIP